MPDTQDTLKERGDRYGDFTGHAKITQALMDVITTCECMSQSGAVSSRRAPWDGLSDVQRQALTVIADKIARILNGDPNYDDNWRDIAGYATLVLERLPK